MPLPLPRTADTVPSTCEPCTLPPAASQSNPQESGLVELLQPVKPSPTVGQSLPQAVVLTPVSMTHTNTSLLLSVAAAASTSRVLAFIALTPQGVTSLPSSVSEVIMGGWQVKGFACTPAAAPRCTLGMLLLLVGFAAAAAGLDWGMPAGPPPVDSWLPVSCAQTARPGRPLLSGSFFKVQQLWVPRES
jgi:hypothetical protein